MTVSYATYRVFTHALWPLAAATAALRGATGSPEWRERAGLLPGAPPGSVWLHAASVGEVAAAAPLARALAERRAGVFVTVVSPTGREAALRSLDGLPVTFAPLDFVPAVRRVITARRPAALMLTETELWPNTLYECSEAGVPTGTVNGRLSERSLRRYTMAGSPMRRLAARMSFAACRTEEDAARFRTLGVRDDRVRVTGDTKFDKLGQPAGESTLAELRLSLGLGADSPVVVFGSVRPREEAEVAAAARAILDERPDARVVAAPRHLERVASMRTEFASRGMSVALRSEGPEKEASTIVLDTTGELAAVYAVGRVAFVGGTLADYGGHDPLEPAAQGVPVLFGPHTETCREAATRLKKAGGAFEVADGSALALAALRLLSDDAARGRAAGSALAVVTQGRGATERTIEFLDELGVLNVARA